MINFKAITASGGLIKSALSSFTFPAGEKHIKREESRELEPTEIAIFQPEPSTIHEDLFQLAMWAQYALTEKSKTVLVMPYVPGARADRGTPFGARTYAQFIGEMWIDQVIIYDPHSEVIVEELKLWSYDNGASDKATITVVRPHEILNTRNSKIVMPNKYDGIIAPDKGAHDRANGVAEAFGIPLYTAEKSRDFETGKLSGFSIDLPDTGHFLIVDDICDGGGTFLGLAAVVPEAVKLDLYVSHGIFSKNALLNLSLKFNRIFTTNSYAPNRLLNDNGDFGDPDADDVFRRIEVIRHLLAHIDLTK
jgi:ribose-phosphate pyrophosphokinase